jgi:hypothetical protein
MNDSVRQTIPLEDRERRTCDRCGIGILTLVDERPHPLFGILGMTLQTLQCDQPTCAQRVFI